MNEWVSKTVHIYRITYQKGGVLWTRTEQVDTSIREVPGSSLGRNTGYPDWDIWGFPQSLQENASK
jgi:hypothetical protein